MPLNLYQTLPTDDGENLTTTTGTDGVLIQTIGLLADFDTVKKTLPIGRPAAWDIDWSGITSGGGVLTLQMSVNDGKDWNTVIHSDGTTEVTVSVTGIPTETTVVIFNKVNPASYRWSYVDTDTAGADAVVVISLQVGG